jgi:hypothetical protein
MTRATPKPISPTEALTRQLLDWAAESQRTYGEAMEAWRTSCPRLTIWEDAFDARLIEVVAAPGVRADARAVRLTAKGRAAIGASE